MNEQIGREWCERHGKKPLYNANGLWVWHRHGSEAVEALEGIPDLIFSMICEQKGVGSRWVLSYESEKDAYFSFGRALREIQDIIK